MATDIEKLRVLIPDGEQIYDGEYLFSDEDLTILVEAARGSVLRAAGYAKIAIGDSEALISKVIQTQDLRTNGAAVAEAFRKSGEALLKRADQEDELDNGFYFNIVYPNQPRVPELTEFWNGVDGQLSPDIVPGTSFDGGTS